MDDDCQTSKTASGDLRTKDALSVPSPGTADDATIKLANSHDIAFKNSSSGGSPSTPSSSSTGAKMDLNRTDLLRLLSYLEGELQARDVAIAALKSENSKQLLYQVKYGRLGLNDPLAALQRDSQTIGAADDFDEQEITQTCKSQLVQLERLIAVQRRAHVRAKQVLAAAERRHARTVRELEGERQRSAADAAQGDDVCMLLEKEREKLKQEIEHQKSEHKKIEKELEASKASLDEEKERHKTMVLYLIQERRQLLVKLQEERQRLQQVTAQHTGEEQTALMKMSNSIDELKQQLQQLKKDRLDLQRQLESERQENESLRNIVRTQDEDLNLIRQNILAKTRQQTAAVSGQLSPSSPTSSVSPIAASPVISPTKHAAVLCPAAAVNSRPPPAYGVPVSRPQTSPTEAGRWSTRNVPAGGILTNPNYVEAPPAAIISSGSGSISRPRHIPHQYASTGSMHQGGGPTQMTRIVALNTNQGGKPAQPPPQRRPVQLSTAGAGRVSTAGGQTSMTGTDYGEIGISPTMPQNYDYAAAHAGVPPNARQTAVQQKVLRQGSADSHKQNTGHVQPTKRSTKSPHRILVDPTLELPPRPLIPASDHSDYEYLDIIRQAALREARFKSPPLEQPDTEPEIAQLEAVIASLGGGGGEPLQQQQPHPPATLMQPGAPPPRSIMNVVGHAQQQQRITTQHYMSNGASGLANAVHVNNAPITSILPPAGVVGGSGVSAALNHKAQHQQPPATTTIVSKPPSETATVGRVAASNVAPARNVVVATSSVATTKGGVTTGTSRRSSSLPRGRTMQPSSTQHLHLRQAIQHRQLSPAIDQRSAPITLTNQATVASKSVGGGAPAARQMVMVRPQPPSGTLPPSGKRPVMVVRQGGVAGRPTNVVNTGRQSRPAASGKAEKRATATQV